LTGSQENLGVGLDIRYARSGGVSIAYQVIGDGDGDLAGRGERELKGVPGNWRLYAVVDA
jgi:hypothetical protein